MSDMVISSQAKNVARFDLVRVLEGSETRGTAKAMMPPRAPSALNSKGKNIVRHSKEIWRASLNGLHNRREEHHLSNGAYPLMAWYSETGSVNVRRGCCVSSNSKPGELSGKLRSMTMLIRSQATKVNLHEIDSVVLIPSRLRVVEGSETRGRGKPVMPPRVPGIQASLDCEIVRYPNENLGSYLNSSFDDFIMKSGTYDNTVEEHNVISSYGENPDAGWIDEGDLPNEDDSSYERQFAVNFMAPCFA